MPFRKFIEQIEQSNSFEEWKKEHKNFFIAHAFTMVEESMQQDWQIGYFDKDNGRITSFVFDREKNIKALPESEIFKEENKKVHPLDLEKVKIDFEQALKTAEELQKTKYPTEKPAKKIVILQNLESGQVWNITYITHSLKTLNIKVDTEKGTILGDKLVSIIQFNK